MKKTLLLLVVYPIFLFSGVFEHLIDKDKTYLFKQNFRCNDATCITSEKNIFDNTIMDNSVKVIKVFLDHNKKVFKVEIELSIYAEKREAFYNAIMDNADKKGNFSYKSYMVNDKYGNHALVDITSKKLKIQYMKYLSNLYYETMKSYKN